MTCINRNGSRNLGAPQSQTLKLFMLQKYLQWNKYNRETKNGAATDVSVTLFVATRNMIVNAPSKMLNRKIEIKENLKENGGRGLHWLELFREWIISAHQAISVADSENLEAKLPAKNRLGLPAHGAKGGLQPKRRL